MSLETAPNKTIGTRKIFSQENKPTYKIGYYELNENTPSEVWLDHACDFIERIIFYLKKTR